MSSWSGGEASDLFGSFKKVKILEAFDDKNQNMNASVELVLLDFFIQTTLIQVREMSESNMGVIVNVGTLESWDQFDMESPTKPPWGYTVHSDATCLSW